MTNKICENHKLLLVTELIVCKESYCVFVEGTRVMWTRVIGLQKCIYCSTRYTYCL